MYLAAQGVTTPIQTSVFRCMQSWLASGEVSAADFATTPLLNAAVRALGEDLLFDDAVEVVCVWIKETQEIHDNMSAISSVAPQLIALAPQVEQAGDDEDRVRGLTRVFSQAGETWKELFLSHPAEFAPLVQVLLTCTAYHDLDIVNITFRCWYYLANAVYRAQRDSSRPDLDGLRQAFATLQDILISHLRFPEDDSGMTSQEKDDFRDFRHTMGDTLKDCCDVLGPDRCITRSLQLIQEGMGRTPLKWQDIEAPLFSMRAMGTRVNPHDEQILPRIMELVPQLPQHPRLKYAGLLVVGRYTEWVAYHTDKIPTLLSYISSGFQDAPTVPDSDADVTAAAARALRYLCLDCRSSLSPYLPELFEFFKVLNSTLSRDGLMEVSEAIAYVISALPPSEALEMLLKFVHPILQGAATGTTPGASEDSLKRSADALKQVDLMLKINTDSASNLPPACAATAQEAFLLIDGIIQAQGDKTVISESACALLRRGIQFFGQTAAEVVPTMVLHLAQAFQASGHPAYVWIVGAAIDNYGLRPEPELREALSQAFNAVSSKVMQLVDEAGSRLDTVSYVIDDYVHACALCCSTAPWILLLSPHLERAVRLALEALDLYQASTVQGALNFMRDLVGHESLLLPPPADGAVTAEMMAAAARAPGAGDTQSATTFALLLRGVLTSGSAPMGAQLVRTLLLGLTGKLDPDDQPITISILRMVAGAFPALSLQWVEAALPALPASSVSQADKEKFVETYRSALAHHNLDQVRVALNTLYRASRRTRDRARMDRIQD